MADLRFGGGNRVGRHIRGDAGATGPRGAGGERNLQRMVVDGARGVQSEEGEVAPRHREEGLVPSQPCAHARPVVQCGDPKEGGMGGASHREDRARMEGTTQVEDHWGRGEVGRGGPYGEGRVRLTEDHARWTEVCVMIEGGWRSTTRGGHAMEEEAAGQMTDWSDGQVWQSCLTEHAMDGRGKDRVSCGKPYSGRPGPILGIVSTDQSSQGDHQHHSGLCGRGIRRKPWSSARWAGARHLPGQVACPS